MTAGRQTDNLGDRLFRAVRAIDPTAPAGPHQMLVSGTVNIGGGAVGGAGGTSMVDDNTFTPAGTSITPMGGYVGGRQVASGHAGAVAMSGSAILQVHVVAGGAGGGAANLTVQGTAGNDVSVGVASGAAGAAGNWPVPVAYASGRYQTVNLGTPIGIFGSLSGVATVHLGLPATVNLGSIPTVNLGQGTVNIGNVPAVTGSVRVTVLGGSVGVLPIGDFTVWTANAAGGGGFASVGVYGSVTGLMTVNLASHIDTVNSAVRVNVVTGGAGGGNANLTTRGTAGTDLHVGQASNNLGAWPNYDGGMWLPVMYPSGYYPTVNIAGGGAGGGFASVAVYGSPANPVYAIGSVNVVNAVGVFGSVSVTGSVNIVPPTNMTVWLANQNAGSGFASVAVYGSPANPVYVIGSVNAVGGGGSVGVTQIGAPWTVTGSVGVTPLAVFTVNMGMGTVNVGNIVGITGSVSILGSVNIGGQPISMVGSVGVTPLASFSLGGIVEVDTRASLTATQWIISGAASGQFVVAGSAPAGVRVRLSSYQLIATGTVDFQWMSPSGVAMSGSMRLLPGAGFGLAGAFPNGPVLIGSQQSAIYILSAGTQNIGGVAIGWLE